VEAGTVLGSSSTSRSGLASCVTCGVTGEVSSACTLTSPFSSTTDTVCKIVELSLCAIAQAAVIAAKIEYARNLKATPLGVAKIACLYSFPEFFG
jgi:hypothetical protein